jgi:hypothetical protein
MTEVMTDQVLPNAYTQVEAMVTLSGALDGSAPRPPIDGHVYAISLMGEPISTVTGLATNVVYIGQGTGGRVRHLWSGDHSVCKSLAWAACAAWAKGRRRLRVRVEIEVSDSPELREVELLNAFLWAHGQMPVFNGRHEGWLPRRLLNAIARRLQDADPSLAFPSDVHNGPRLRLSNRTSTFTAVDIYGVPPEGSAWSWRGSLLWTWPSEWVDDVSRGAMTDPWGPGLFVLIAPSGVTDADWKDVPSFLGEWSDCARALRLEGGGDSLATPNGKTAAHLGTLCEQLTAQVLKAIPREGLNGDTPRSPGRRRRS